MSPAVCSKASLFSRASLDPQLGLPLLSGSPIGPPGDRLIQQCASPKKNYYGSSSSGQFSYYGGDGSPSDAIFMYDFRSPAIAWTGYCHEGDCQICKEEETRCESSGIPQTCQRGKWRASVGGVGLLAAGQQAERFVVPFAVTVFIATALLIIIQSTHGALLFKISLNAKRESMLGRDSVEPRSGPPGPYAGEAGVVGTFTHASAREFEMGAAGNAGFGRHP